jgi:hypothetical protein
MSDFASVLRFLSRSVIGDICCRVFHDFFRLVPIFKPDAIF